MPLAHANELPVSERVSESAPEVGFLQQLPQCPYTLSPFSEPTLELLAASPASDQSQFFSAAVEK